MMGRSLEQSISPAGPWTTILTILTILGLEATGVPVSWERGCGENLFDVRNGLAVSTSLTVVDEKAVTVAT